jgi:hypothetical protein
MADTFTVHYTVHYSGYLEPPFQDPGQFGNPISVPMGEIDKDHVPIRDALYGSDTHWRIAVYYDPAGNISPRFTKVGAKSTSSRGPAIAPAYLTLGEAQTSTVYMPDAPKNQLTVTAPSETPAIVPAGLYTVSWTLSLDKTFQPPLVDLLSGTTAFIAGLAKGQCIVMIGLKKRDHHLEQWQFGFNYGPGVNIEPFVTRVGRPKDLTTGNTLTVGASQPSKAAMRKDEGNWISINPPIAYTPSATLKPAHDAKKTG